MYTARFLTVDEIYLVGSLFEVDSSIVKKQLDPTEVDNLIQFLKNKVEKGIGKVSMTFDENNNPYGVHVGYEVPKVNGWVFGLTKVRVPNYNYYKTASAMSTSVDLLMSYMENKGYYKWWSTTTEKRRKYRTDIMCRYSKQLPRYEIYDELVIPRGQKSNVELFDVYRPIVDWSDVVVTIHVLNNEARSQLIKEKQHTDYIGE
jgi:hypothetical protein